MKGTFQNDENVLCLDVGISYSDVYMCHRHQTSHLCIFLYLNVI